MVSNWCMHGGRLCRGIPDWQCGCAEVQDSAAFFCESGVNFWTIQPTFSKFPYPDSLEKDRLGGWTVDSQTQKTNLSYVETVLREGSNDNPTLVRVNVSGILIKIIASTSGTATAGECWVLPALPCCPLCYFLAGSSVQSHELKECIHSWAPCATKKYNISKSQPVTRNWRKYFKVIG